MCVCVCVCAERKDDGGSRVSGPCHGSVSRQRRAGVASTDRCGGYVNAFRGVAGAKGDFEVVFRGMFVPEKSRKIIIVASEWQASRGLGRYFCGNFREPSCSGAPNCRTRTLLMSIRRFGRKQVVRHAI